MSNDTTPSGSALRLPSSLRIADVGEFRAQCDAALEGEGMLGCEADGVEFIDAAGLQLLVALARTCAERSRGFEVRAPSAAFTGAARVAGFGALLGMAPG